ncbi:MAG: RNaseH superfamily protein [Caudoviricetes sp.]|nr:MAG: RNaseH superfamily protein [Caudoviricetes sp.]
MSGKFKAWHQEAIDLHQQGLSGRAIAKLLGKGKTTVNDVIASMYGPPNLDEEVIPFALKEPMINKKPDGPRILVYDIETAPMLAHVWKMWDNNVGLNQLQADWYILSFAAKWLGEDEIFYYDQRDAVDQTDDSFILSKLWKLLNEADIVIGQNVRRFDTKKVNARFILNGFPKPATYRQIDTMVVARDQFGFTSNKLEYLAKALCPEHVKSKHSKFPGHEMWVECMKGNREAWEEMEAYNRDDILATEGVYNVLSSWDNKLPNFDVYVDDLLDMSEWVHDGYVFTQFAKYKRYRNIRTGVQRRSRFNELTTEKKKQLLANIA